MSRCKIMHSLMCKTINTNICYSLLLVFSAVYLQACANEKEPLSVLLTTGSNGAPRDAIFIAGETIYMKVVVKGIAIPKTGKCLLPTRHYIVDKDDKIAYSHSNDNASARVSIGYADAKLLLECPVNTMLEPGEYFFVTEMRNRETGQIYRNRKLLTIIPWNEFAISQFCFTTARASNVPIGPSFEVGQPALLHFVVQSPQANKDENYRLASRLRILNESGKNVEQVREETISELPATSRGAYPMWTEINISMPGTYLAEVEVKDLVSGKAITKSIPFRVFDSLASIRRTPTR